MNLFLKNSIRCMVLTVLILCLGIGMTVEVRADNTESEADRLLETEEVQLTGDEDDPEEFWYVEKEPGLLSEKTCYTEGESTYKGVILGKLPFNRKDITNGQYLTSVNGCFGEDGLDFEEEEAVFEYVPNGIELRLFLSEWYDKGYWIYSGENGISYTIDVTGPNVTKEMESDAGEEVRYFKDYELEEFYGYDFNFCIRATLVMMSRICARLRIPNDDLMTALVLDLQYDIEKKYSLEELRQYASATDFINKTQFRMDQNDPWVSYAGGIERIKADDDYTKAGSVEQFIKMKMKENQVNKYYIVPVSNTAYGIKFSKNTAYAAEAVEKARDNKLEVIETKSDYIIRTSSQYSKTEKMNIESGISYTDPMYAESSAEKYEQKLGLTKDQYKICGIVKKYNEYRVNYPFTEKEFVQAWAAEMDSWGTREGHWDTYLYGDEHFDYWYTSDKKLHYGYGAGNYGQFYAFYVHREVLHKEPVYKFTIKDLGTYTVTTRGINNYKGTLTRTITIKRKTITEDMISKIPDQEVTGKAVKPEITVTYGDFKLSPGTDYSVSYKNNIEEGTATVIVKGKGNYEGTVTRTFKIGPRTIKESMVAKIPDQEYTGWWIQPDIVVTYDGVKLSEGKDYTVYYYNNRDKGTAVAYIEGQGLFSGWATVTFEIVDKQPDGSKVFLDVQDPSAWYYDAVYWAAENGITSGYGEGTFQPMANLSRAQVVTFLYNLAGQPTVSDKTAADFTDVPENAWYYKAVRWAVANGITSGYGQGTFKPNVICNRAMIVTFLMNYAEKNQMYREPVTMSSFKDVPANAWYKKSVDWAVENNITSGYGENSFQPLVPCNRAMMVVFLKKLSELPKVS